MIEVAHTSPSSIPPPATDFVQLPRGPQQAQLPIRARTPLAATTNPFANDSYEAPLADSASSSHNLCETDAWPTKVKVRPNPVELTEKLTGRALLKTAISGDRLDVSRVTPEMILAFSKDDRKQLMHALADTDAK